MPEFFARSLGMQDGAASHVGLRDFHDRSLSRGQKLSRRAAASADVNSELEPLVSLNPSPLSSPFLHQALLPRPIHSNLPGIRHKRSGEGISDSGADILFGHSRCEVLRKCQLHSIPTFLAKIDLEFRSEGACFSHGDCYFEPEYSLPATLPSVCANEGSTRTRRFVHRVNQH